MDWSDTKILEAEPGDYITIVRKAKQTGDWYLGAITDENSRIAEWSLDFLTAGKKYEAIIYRDADNSDWQTNPEAYVIEKKIVTGKSKLKIQLAKSGGCAIQIKQINEEAKKGK